MGVAVAVAAVINVARSSAATPTVPSDIRAIFDKPAYKNATWGLRVQDGPNVLLNLNAARPFLIGSVRKIFTVGELLNAVGGAHTYDTPVYRSGTIQGASCAGI